MHAHPSGTARRESAFDRVAVPADPRGGQDPCLAEAVPQPACVAGDRTGRRVSAPRRLRVDRQQPRRGTEALLHGDRRPLRLGGRRKSGTESGTVSARSEPHRLARRKRNDRVTRFCGRRGRAVSNPSTSTGTEGQQFGTKKNTEEQYGDSRSDSTGLIEPSAILSKPLISEREPPDWVRKQIAALPPEVIAALWVMFRGQTHGSPSDRSR